MSKYDWESGELKIPASEWSAFKRALQDALAATLLRRYEMAVALFTHLKTVSKGKRQFDFAKEAEQWAQGQQRTRGVRNWAMARDNLAVDAGWGEAAFDTVEAVLPHGKDEPRKPKMPKKKDFKADRSSLRINHRMLRWEASIVLDPKTRTVHWSVPENNHAREYAWGQPMGVAFSRALRAVKWTRNSGGKFIGNDEYNRDADYEGGGGNYVTQRFGPLGDR